jgi:hypothetical protein
LLYDQGFTISGARNRLAEATASGRGAAFAAARKAAGVSDRAAQETQTGDPQHEAWVAVEMNSGLSAQLEDGQGAVVLNRPERDDPSFILSELRAIRELLSD